MKPALLLLAVVAVVGCSGADPDDGSPRAAQDGTAPVPVAAGGEPAGAGCGLSMTSFTLPAVAGLPRGSFETVESTASSFEAVASTATCMNGAPFTYELRDMTGDQQPDLLVRSACDDSTIGPLAWRVYANTGTGFAAAPTRFALPLPRPPACAKTTLVDVDGDLRPDLLTTSHCGDATVGTSRWLVNRNNGAGFDPTTSFALPTPPIPAAFDALERSSPECPAGRPAYKVFDLDGDRKLDLVISSVCNDTRIGTSLWRVHRGTGAGFEADALLFTLPTTPAPLLHMYRSPDRATGDCATSPVARTYEVADFDGDFAPDLLVTMQCNDVRVGTTRWHLHRNAKTGFAPVASTVQLPPGPGGSGAFTSLRGDASCVERRPAYATLDVTGDFRRDLLVTQSCADPASGVSRWLLYDNVAAEDSAAPTPRALVLPHVLGGTAASPLRLEGELACTGHQRPRFVASCLVNRRLSLVVTKTCADTSVGATRWLLYEAGCR